MLQDRYGNEVSTSSTAARDAYVQGIDLFLAADHGIEDALNLAIEEDENFALAHLAIARNRQINGHGRAAHEALANARAVAKGLTVREQGQMETLGLLIEGKPPAGYRAARAQLADYPRDVMVAQTCLGVFGLIGFSGQPGREAENLALCEILAPHYGDDWWFLCLLAFGQMEAGQIGPAASAIERSLDGNPRNGNAAHYRSHLYYENGETDAGFAYLDEWQKDYDKRGLLHCHISWHIALWAMARGDVDRMWAVVDADVDPRGALGPPVNVLTDMAAILYRAELAGVEVPVERWQVVSDFAAKLFPKNGLAFVDIHAALSHAMAGNQQDLARIIRDAKGPAADMVSGLAEAFSAIAAKNWLLASQHLSVAMADHARMGGSRAQRDLVEYAMVNVLMKLGQSEEAGRMLNMRRPLTATKGVVVGL